MECTESTIGGRDSQSVIEFLILNIPVFSGFKEAELKVIEKYLKLVEAKPGDIILKEGDNGDYVCFIVCGSLDVRKKSEDGDDVLLANLSEGRSFGEMAIIDELPRSATVIACKNTILFTLSKQNFDYILSEYPNIGIKILKGIARWVSLNLRKTSYELVDHILPVL